MRAIFDTHESSIMSPLSILSILLAIITWLYLIYLIRRPNIYVSNIQRILIISIILGLITLAINPQVVNSFLAIFSFNAGNGGRIIGLLTFSSFILFLWNTQLQSRASSLEITIDRLVRELAKDNFRSETARLIEAPICVIIPAYDEEDNIGKVLEQMPNEVYGKQVEVLVIVDGGVDKTADVVRTYDAHVATHVINRGGGAALHAGFDIALENDVEIIVTLDADGQHVPEEMYRLIKPILDGQADVVNGSRVLGDYEKDTVVRAAGVVFFNQLISLLTLQKITDCSNSYRAFTRESLEEIRPYLSQRQFHTTEFLIEMLKRRKRVIEVPITIRKRISGTSKKGTNMRYATGFTLAIFKTWLR